MSTVMSPVSHPNVPNVELSPGFKALPESFTVQPEQFCHPWFDSRGLDHWQCGSVCLVAMGGHFPSGSTSHFQQGFHSEESLPSNSMFTSQSLSLPGVSAHRKEAAEPMLPELPECQSPVEAYFNPHSVKSRDSFVSFFPEQCQTNAQPSLNGGSADFDISDAKAVRSDAEFAVPLGMQSLMGKVWQKSLHGRGCREVQDALEQGDNRTCAAIASEMRGHVWEAVESPHANHVLQKCIGKSPPEASQFIIDELMNRSRAATYLARHKFGCRIVERLLEHCRPEQLRQMIGDILTEAKSLCVHRFGNFVIQHLFEHGSKDEKRELAVVVLACMPKLSSDPQGVGVIAKALEFAPVEEQVALARVLLQAPHQLMCLASHRHGQEVALVLIQMKGTEGAEARKCFDQKEVRRVLSFERHGRKLIKVLDALP